MADIGKVATIGGWEGLAVAVVIAAWNDANKGDERARQWLRQVAPYVLGMVFPDLDPRIHYCLFADPAPGGGLAQSR